MTTIAAQTRTPALSQTRTAALLALALGAVLLFLAGFAPSPALHNTAHDTRHALIFPCH